MRAQAPDFIRFCLTPDVAAEVTLQPIRRFGFDAAILFSDILVVPLALGRKVEFLAGEGPKLEPMADATAALWLPSLVRSIEKEAPGIDIRMVPLTTREPRPLLLRGDIDLAIGF